MSFDNHANKRLTKFLKRFNLSFRALTTRYSAGPFKLMRMDPTQITPYLGMIYLVVLSIYRLLLLLCEIDVTFRYYSKMTKYKYVCVRLYLYARSYHRHEEC